LLGALGQRYGCYTSPHLVDYNERIHVNGVAATDEDLLQAFEVVEKARGNVSLTYFEFGTLAAIEILARARLDVAVMEVGLGGRLDAVNLIDADCAVITPIGLDHQAWLGNDLVSIGREKAGIMRPGRPVISGEPNPPSSIVDRAHDLGSPLKCLGKDFVIERVEDRARLAVDGRMLDLPLPVLAGPHQLNNLATALAGLLELFPGAADTPGLLERGIRAVTLRGRFERICERPAIWIDVGHNPMAATAVAAALAGVSDSENLEKRRCVIAMLIDKDAESVAAELNHVVDSWYCAGLKGERGQTGAELASRIQESAGPLTVKVFERVSQALDSAISDSGPKDGILVFGSFLTATEVLLHWRSQNHDT
jgi:dihydrofolate synthase/folylpolyglutamate synthase